MKLLLASVLVLILAISSPALSSTINAGPYIINLDIKTAQEPTLTVDTNTGSGSTSYLTNVKLNNQTVAALNIISYNEPQYAGFASTTMKKLLMNSLAREGQITYPSLTERTIDGSTAEVMSYWDPQLGTNVTIAEYWKDGSNIPGYSIPAGRTKVEILSKLETSLDENLLNSLSIQMPARTAASSSLNRAVIPSGISDRGRPQTMDIDQRCMQNWLDVGYTPSMIASLGWCRTP
jgi:hypothetical protein